MKTFATFRTYVRTLPGVPGDITVEPGPDLPDVPGRWVVLTPYGGPGLLLEGALDGRAWQVRVAGLQGNYDDAEAIANAIDVGLLSIVAGNDLGVHGVQRVGGAPNPLLKDDSDRWQFICSYIFDATMALAN